VVHPCSINPLETIYHGMDKYASVFLDMSQNDTIFRYYIYGWHGGLSVEFFVCLCYTVGER